MSQSDFVSRGQALVAAGQFQEAVKVCRLGLLGRPTTVEGRVVLGSALLALKRYDEVLAEMRVALELDHGAVPAHTLKAEALLRKGDHQAALDALAEGQKLAPNDSRIQQLVAEARGGAPSRPSTSHPAVGFIGRGDTRNYANHAAGDGSADGSESFTKPTSLSSPGAPRRTAAGMPAARNDATPGAAILAVGDKSGTVEVDPDLEGVQLDDDVDFDDLAAPPSATPAPAAAAPAKRGTIKSGKQIPGKSVVLPKNGRGAVTDKRTPTMDLVVDDDSDVLEVDETNSRVSSLALPKGAQPKPARSNGGEGATRQGQGPGPGRGTAVRNAVQMPSGPIDISGPPPQPLPPAPQAPQRPSLASALPTVAAMHPPQPMPHAQLPNPFAQTMIPQQPMMVPPPAQRQTMIAVAQPPPPNMFAPPEPPPNWGAPIPPMHPDPRSLAAAQEPTMRPSIPMDPHLQAMLNGIPPEHPSAQMIDPGPALGSVKKTGVRKSRSKLQITLWILVGIVVIGGGVFAGFQIRAMRLKKQVAIARTHAMELAKFDTFAGWAAARDELSRIVQASGTPENQAALARARALIAYEFDDAVDDARVTVDALKDKTSLDANIAQAYLGLATSDLKAARSAANAALSDAPTDPAANYLAGQVALMYGDLADAVKKGKAAVDKEPRALYAVGLARIYAAAGTWTEALPAVDRALSVMADQPSAVIERAIVLSESGKIAADQKLATDARTQLAKLVGDAKKNQLSQAQVAFGYLALAELDFARNDPNAALADITAAGAANIEDQRFTEQAAETLYSIGQLSHAQNLATNALQQWPKSARLHLSLAQIQLASGKGDAALAALKDYPDLDKTPAALALRGEGKLAIGDVEGARADLDAAAKLAPKLEAALVGRAWVELAAGDADSAKKQLGDLADRSTSPAVVTVNAAILRRDPASRDKAKAALEAIVNGAGGPGIARAQLELARVYHDTGDFAAARKAYAAASTSGSFAARLETGLIAIEDRDPAGGRDTLDALLKEAGDHPPARLVLETARARMLMGDHAGAATLLASADALPNVTKWQLQRERGRLHIRRGDVKAAVSDLGSALEGCGGDPETFLLATDAAIADEKSGLMDKIKTLAPERLKGQAELQIVTGKLHLAAGKIPEAETSFKAARDQLRSDKAAPRRIAQASYGLGFVAYNKEHDPEAIDAFKTVLADDPSLYDAYLFQADLVKDKVAAFEAAKTAVRFNGDYPRAWHVLGKLAAKNGDKVTLGQAIEKLKVLAKDSDDLKELEKLR